MILPISIYGNPVLRKKSKKVKYSYPNLKILISNMFETMYQANGIGLSAPQLGLNIKIFIIDISSFNDEKNSNEKKINNFKKIFINPKIFKIYGKIWKFKEGCLSIPGIIENINRPEYIDIEYYDEHWEKQKKTLKGLIGRVIQHEYDHLNGKLFIDYLSPLKKQLIKKKLNNILKKFYNSNYTAIYSK